MVATDTIIGIVGAVVLVGVMAGVFVYEYNNTDDSGTDLRVEFRTSYPTLDTDGDLDGDGIANFEDDDLDGDGIPNASDDAIIVSDTAEGAVGPRVEPVTSPSGSLSGDLEKGVRLLRVHVAVSPTAPDPLGVLNAFQVRVLLDDGTVLFTGTTTTSIDFETEDLVEGGYSVVVQPQQASLGGGWTIDTEAVYS